MMPLDQDHELPGGCLTLLGCCLLLALLAL